MEVRRPAAPPPGWWLSAINVTAVWAAVGGLTWHSWQATGSLTTARAVLLAGGLVAVVAALLLRGEFRWGGVATAGAVLASAAALTLTAALPA